MPENPEQGLLQQMLAAQKREARQVLQELLQMRSLMPLLMKPRNGGAWSRDERAELLRHLRHLSRLSPYLLLLLLPGSALFLPAYAWWLDRRRQRRLPG
ncbi:MAG: hypothetical protein KGN39_00965 [Betaproteobacteria bacterium]|nr:hypothetical protein [Betaproteobacteria bacterium]